MRRRNFLAGLASSMLMAGGLRVARAIEPIQRVGGPQFQFSLAAYSYRDLLQRAKERLTLSDFVRDCAAMQLEGVELTSYYFPQPVTAEYLVQLKGECFRLGLDVSGTAVGNDFGVPAGPAREKQIADVKKWIEHAQLLGAPVIRIFAGHVPQGDDPAAAYARMVSAIEECCDYAGQYGVHLALENHGGPTATAEGLLAFVRDVKSPWFGVNLDTGNFHTEDVYGDLAKVAPYATNVQIKVSITPAGASRQATDLSRIAKILRDTGYRGYVVLEYEESGDPREECPPYVEQMRQAFAAA